MIKVEHTIFKDRNVVSFAFEGSNEEDLPTLDLLYQALSDKPNLRLGYITTQRLVMHVSKMDESLFRIPETK